MPAAANESKSTKSKKGGGGGLRDSGGGECCGSRCVAAGTGLNVGDRQWTGGDAVQAHHRRQSARQRQGILTDRLVPSQVVGNMLR